MPLVSNVTQASSSNAVVVRPVRLLPKTSSDIVTLVIALANAELSNINKTPE